MRLNVNPTRMELIKLKKKVVTARRGHKLLKEKRDGLMKQFLTTIKKARKLRENIEKKLGSAFKAFIFASADMRPEVMAEALAYPAKETSLKVKTENVMSVNVPRFDYKAEGDFLSYSLATTSAELDASLETFSEVLEDMVKLAEIEHSAKLMAAEIEKTRRRVNALEYVFIPNMDETIKYITAKLNEQERSTITALMKVKDIITEQENN
ncbi:MAG: V-type ATP synthase subunit D [Patescibacteria group bacterium]|nr:V-type ATP synthase subunit D [Patescibacteria group bacterium]